MAGQSKNSNRASRMTGMGRCLLR